MDRRNLFSMTFININKVYIKFAKKSNLGVHFSVDLICRVVGVMKFCKNTFSSREMHLSCTIVSKKIINFTFIESCIYQTYSCISFVVHQLFRKMRVTIFLKLRI